MTITEHLRAKNKPEDGTYFWLMADYEDAFHDCRTVVWETVGSYQGDHVVLVQAPDGQYGFGVIGYGSCSGCDALEACGTIAAGAALLEKIREGFHWEPTAARMATYLTDKCDRQMKEVYMTDDERQTVWPKLIAAITAEIGVRVVPEGTA